MLAAEKSNIRYLTQKPRLNAKMKRRHIIIVDKDRNNQQVLRNNFVEAGFEVDLAIDDHNAINKINSIPFDALITELTSPGIDGYGLLEAVKKSKLNSKTPVIFLTTKNDVWNRVKSLQQGARDYIIKPIHVKELVARIRMVLNRIERKSEEEQIFKKKFSGKLEDISVFDLIKVFGLEKKTGILSLFRENGQTGQIFFEKGNVINAGTLLLNAEEAIYKMMTWRKGFFSMHFCEIDVLDEINTSNLAILLQGAMRMEQSEELQRHLPPLTAVVATTPNFKKITAKQELKTELQQFLELFDGQRTLGEIIDHSKSDELETLKRIRKLFDMGFLNIMDEQNGVHAESGNGKDGHLELNSGSNTLIEELLEEEPVSTDTQPEKYNFTITKTPQLTSESGYGKTEPATETTIEYATKPEFMEHAIPETHEQLRDLQLSKLYAKAKGTVLVISKEISQSKSMAESLATLHPVIKNHNMRNLSDIYVGTASFKHDIYLNLTTISTEKEFDPLLEYLAPKTLGYVLLVDTKRANWNYYFYLLNVLRRRLTVPSVIVITNQGSNEGSVTIDEIKSRLNLQENEQIMFCSEYNEANSKKIIFSLFKNYYKKP